MRRPCILTPFVVTMHTALVDKAPAARGLGDGGVAVHQAETCDDQTARTALNRWATIVSSPGRIVIGSTRTPLATLRITTGGSPS